MNIKLNIIYEDENLLVINKPAGLLVIPDRWDASKPNLISILKDRHPNEKLYVVHRLDEGTSGVIIFARTAEIHRHLCLQLEERHITKIYLAIVKGEVESDGIIDLAVDKSPRGKGKMVIRKKGKASITEYHVLERYRNFTYLKVIPKTGRTHQIRVHLRAIGHPLAIDPIYGDREPIFLSKLKRNYRFKPDQEERPLIARLTLHAAEICFRHPIVNNEMILSAELPKDMRALIHALGKYCIRLKSIS